MMKIKVLKPFVDGEGIVRKIGEEYETESAWIVADGYAIEIAKPKAERQTRTKKPTTK